MANSKNKCAYCGNYERVENGMRNNTGFFCNPRHYIDYVNSKKNKQQKKELHQSGASSRTGKTDTYASRFSALVVSFNKMRRTDEIIWFLSRGLPPTCISCSCLLTTANITNGHLITVASSRKLAIDPVNSYLQCTECNSGLSGNINGTSDTHGYLKGLEKRFGDVMADEIITYCNEHHPEERLGEDEIKKLKRSYTATAKKNNQIISEYF